MFRPEERSVLCRCFPRIVFLEQGSPLGLSKYGPVCSALAESLFYTILSFGLTEGVLEHTFFLMIYDLFGPYIFTVVNIK